MKVNEYEAPTPEDEVGNPKWENPTIVSLTWTTRNPPQFSNISEIADAGDSAPADPESERADAAEQTDNLTLVSWANNFPSQGADVQVRFVKSTGTARRANTWKWPILLGRILRQAEYASASTTQNDSLSLKALATNSSWSRSLRVMTGGYCFTEDARPPGVTQQRAMEKSRPLDSYRPRDFYQSRASNRTEHRGPERSFADTPMGGIGAQTGQWQDAPRRGDLVQREPVKARESMRPDSFAVAGSEGVQPRKRVWDEEAGDEAFWREARNRDLEAQRHKDNAAQLRKRAGRLEEEATELFCRATQEDQAASSARLITLDELDKRLRRY